MKEKVISSISEYIDFVEEFKGNAYFRGQADSSWLIQPNIFRDTTKLNSEVATLNSSEENNTREFDKICEKSFRLGFPREYAMALIDMYNKQYEDKPTFKKIYNL